jgi:hypothetical protein
MKVGRLALRFPYSVCGALVMMGAWSSGVLAQHDQTHAQTQPSPATSERKSQAGDFVRVVRDATRKFRDVSVAEAAGYAEQFGCVSGSDQGAMGVHLVNGPLVADGVLDPARPELLVYEPTRDGTLELTGADYLVIAEAWHANNEAPPELMGQLFHLFESPNRFGLPAFYTLHVWAWKENPNGTFVNWHPNVSCDGFNPQTP